VHCQHHASVQPVYCREEWIEVMSLPDCDSVRGELQTRRMSVIVRNTGRQLRSTRWEEEVVVEGGWGS
jgi:hypothetical protein